MRLCRIVRCLYTTSYLYFCGMTDINDVTLGGGGETQEEGKRGLMFHLHTFPYNFTSVSTIMVSVIDYFIIYTSDCSLM